MACILTITDFLATLTMIIAQLNMAVVVIFYKIAENLSASLRVVLAYRMMGATIALMIIDFIYERFWKKNRNDRGNAKLSTKILTLAFFCALFGSTVSYNLYAWSLTFAAATTVTAISNMSPAISFVMAVIFKQEKVELRKQAGRCKVLGTVLAITGAMVLSFYKGINFLDPPNWKISLKTEEPVRQTDHGLGSNYNEAIGILLALASCVSSSASVIIEAKLLEIYAGQIRVTLLTTSMGAIQCLCFAAMVEREKKSWTLSNKPAVMIFMIVYMAVIASAVMMILTAWCIAKQGPFFVTSFSPVTLIAVVALSLLVLGEPLNAGSVIGAGGITLGLYFVIYGKWKGGSVQPTDTPGESPPPPVATEA